MLESWSSRGPINKRDLSLSPCRDNRTDIGGQSSTVFEREQREFIPEPTTPCTLYPPRPRELLTTRVSAWFLDPGQSHSLATDRLWRRFRAAAIDIGQSGEPTSDSLYPLPPVIL